jgi:hypothetical protein
MGFGNQLNIVRGFCRCLYFKDADASANDVGAISLVRIGMLMLIENAFNTRINPIMFGIDITIYLLLYMGLWFWIKRKGMVRL